MKFWNRILSILLVMAMLFNNISPLVVMALESDISKITTISANNIKAKGNIEIEFQLALPVRDGKDNGIVLSITDESNNKASINLSDVNSAQDGIYENHISLGSEGNAQNIRVMITKRGYDGKLLGGNLENNNLVYYSINLYSLNTGKYNLEFKGKNFVTYNVPVELKDFSKRISLSNEKGLFEIGDVNQDNKVDTNDEKEMIKAIESNDLSKDLNLDGSVDVADLNYITAIINSSEKKIKIEDTSAIMNSDNVSFGLAEGTRLEEGSSLDNLFNEDGTVKLKRDSEISEENPIQLDLDLGGSEDKAIEMSEVRIGVGQENVPQKMKLLVVDDSDETLEYTVDDPDQGLEGVHLFTEDNSDDTIKVDLGKQVAVKKVTIVITESSTNNLAEIAKVEFLNNVKVETKEPEGFYTPQNIHIDDTKSEQLTITFDSVPNVSGYEIKIVGGKMNGVIFQTTFTTFTIEDLKNYQTYKIYVQSSNQEWRSGWSDAHEGTPKANGRAPKVDMVSAEGAYGGIDFSWKMMDDTQYYKLYYREVGTNEYTLVDELKTNSYQARGLKAGTEYEGYVIGVNEIGESNDYTLVKARTKANGAVIYPKYKLINDTVENGKTNHIKEVHYHTGTMTNDNKYSMVDDDFNTYWTHKDWQISAHNGFNTGAPVIVLDNKYKMDEFVLTVPDSYAASLKSGGPNSNDIQVHYWDTEHSVYDNTDRKVVKGTLTAQYDEMERKYYLLKLEDPIEARAVSFALTVANNVNDMQIDEVKFYHYDSLVDDVANLFTDDLRLVLANGVNQAKIDELRKRANEQDHGEDNPYKASILADLKYAEKILNDEKIDDVIELNPNISNTYNNHVKFAMTISDYQPLGVVARPGETLNVYVGSNGPINAQIVFTQYHAEASEWNSVVSLNKGLKIIQVPTIGS